MRGAWVALALLPGLAGAVEAGCLMPLLEREQAEKAAFQRDFAEIVGAAVPEEAALVEDASEVQILLGARRVARIRHILATDPARLTDLNSLRGFAWSTADERAVAATDPAYAADAETIAALLARTDGAEGWAEVRETARRLSTESQTYVARSVDFSNALIDLSAEMEVCFE